MKIEIDFNVILMSTKKIGDVEPYSQFKIVGMGDLAMQTRNKTGYGCCVEHESFKMMPGNRNYWSGTPHVEVKQFHFTEEELQTHFILYDEYYKNYIRDEKLNTLLNE
jgi:hypothetical protein